MQVSVASGQITGVVYADDGTAVADTDSQDVRTIDEVFDELEMVVADHPARLELTYDPVLSYPTSALVDQSARTADDEYRILISDLVAD